jgi:hypothetical protein
MENWNRTRSESKDISPTSPPAALLSPLDPAWARIACDGEIHGNDLQWGEDHHICPSECQAREAAAFTHSYQGSRPRQQCFCLCPTVETQRVSSAVDCKAFCLGLHDATPQGCLGWWLLDEKGNFHF